MITTDNKEFTEKFIYELFDEDLINRSDIIWNEINGEVTGRMYAEHIGNKQLLPLVAIYGIFITPIWDTSWTLDKKIIKEFGGRKHVLEIEITFKDEL